MFYYLKKNNWEITNCDFITSNTKLWITNSRHMVTLTSTARSLNFAPIFDFQTVIVACSAAKRLRGINYAGHCVFRRVIN